jgi:hypothetical protein
MAASSSNSHPIFRSGEDCRHFNFNSLQDIAAGGLETRIRELLKLGFNRVLFLAPVAQPDKQWPVLERYAALIRNFV